jgi:hypothetical protein
MKKRILLFIFLVNGLHSEFDFCKLVKNNYGSLEIVACVASSLYWLIFDNSICNVQNKDIILKLMKEEEKRFDNGNEIIEFEEKESYFFYVEKQASSSCNYEFPRKKVVGIIQNNLKDNSFLTPEEFRKYYKEAGLTKEDHKKFTKYLNFINSSYLERYFFLIGEENRTYFRYVLCVLLSYVYYLSFYFIFFKTINIILVNNDKITKYFLLGSFALSIFLKVIGCLHEYYTKKESDDRPSFRCQHNDRLINKLIFIFACSIPVFIFLFSKIKKTK